MAASPTEPKSLPRKILGALTPATQGVVRGIDSAPNGVLRATREPSPRMSLAGHVLLAFLFVGTIVAYTVYAFVSFAQRPEVETFRQVPAIDVPPRRLRVTGRCTNPPNCGDLTVIVDYAASPRCALKAAAFARTVPASETGTESTFLVDLCDVGDTVYSVTNDAPLRVPGVVIEFSSVNPGFSAPPPMGVANASFLAVASVVVHSVDATLPMQRAVTLDQGQLKALILGQSRTLNIDGAVTSSELVPVAIQYEAKRPGQAWRASLVLALQPQASIFERSRPGDALSIVASIGGAAHVVGAFLVLLAPVVAFVLPGEAAASVVVAAETASK